MLMIVMTIMIPIPIMLSACSSEQWHTVKTQPYDDVFCIGAAPPIMLSACSSEQWPTVKTQPYDDVFCIGAAPCNC